MKKLLWLFPVLLLFVLSFGFPGNALSSDGLSSLEGTSCIAWDYVLADVDHLALNATGEEPFWLGKKERLIIPTFTIVAGNFDIDIYNLSVYLSLLE